MKKIICLLLAFIMTAAVLAGCAGNPGDTNTEQNGTGASTGKTDTTNNADQTDFDPGKTDPQKSTELEDLKNGDKFTFGVWEQDGDGKTEPISWIVIRQDVGKMLVLSENVLEYMCFKQGTDENKYPRSLYDESDLRAFLNGDFYNNAFSDSEKAMILQTKITTQYKDEHYNELTLETEDKIFALSKDENARYVAGIGTNVYGVPTKRVADDNPYELSTIGAGGVDKAASWWLRDMGTDSNKYAAYVRASTSRKYNDDTEVYKKSGVRPAMWIVYNANDMNGYAKGEVQPKKDAALDEKIAALKVGGKLQFGVYDNNLYSVDGYETLTWTVISEDDESFLLLSDTFVGNGYYVFDERKDIEDTSWAESTLRKYINSDEFLDLIFTPQEKAKLILTHVVTTGEDERSGGAATDDLIFLPDVSDVDKYPSSFNVSFGHKYWLRSQRSWAPYIAYIAGTGSVYYDQPAKQYAVRAMVRITKQG